MLVVVLDPPPFDLLDSTGSRTTFDRESGAVSNQIRNTFVEVGGNVEIAIVGGASGSYDLAVAQVGPMARGVAVAFDAYGEHAYWITDALRSGVRRFEFRVGEPELAWRPVSVPRSIYWDDRGTTEEPVEALQTPVVLAQYQSLAFPGGTSVSLAGQVDYGDGPYESVGRRLAAEEHEPEDGEKPEEKLDDGRAPEAPTPDAEDGQKRDEPSEQPPEEPDEGEAGKGELQEGGAETSGIQGEVTA
jgi:hypothetical protein